MNIFNFLLLFGFAHLATGSMLKCGEEITVNRGEKKTLRFWSTDDELLRVEMVPDRGESDASALLAMFKNSYNKGSDIFGSRGEPIKLKSSLGSKKDEKETLYRIDEKIFDKFKNHLESKQESTQYTADNETQTTTSSVTLKDEDRDKYFDPNDKIISQVEVETKSEHKEESTSQIPEKEYDVKTSTDMNIIPEEEMETVEEQTTHVEELISSDGFIATAETTTEVYEEELVLDFSYDSDIKENEPSTGSEIKNYLHEQNYEKPHEVSTNYKFGEETTEAQGINEVITSLPEIDIRVNIDPTTSNTAEQTTSTYPHEISISSTDLPLEEKYEDHLREDITEDSIHQTAAYQDNDIMDTTESVEETSSSHKKDPSTPNKLDETDVYQDKDTSYTTESLEDKITSHKKEDHLTTIKLDETVEDEDVMSTTESFEDSITLYKKEDSSTHIPEVESTTLPARLDYKLTNEESTETDKFTESNNVTLSIETRTDNLEIPTTESTQDFTRETGNIKVNSDDISSLETTTEFETFQDDHTEKTLIVIDPTQLGENVKEMENIPEIYIEEEYLEDIISELKSQEAQLKHPSTEDNSQNTGTMADGEDTESIDLKLSILKNIIKGITSEIEAKEKQKIGIEDHRDHIYIPYEEEEAFTKDENQNNEKQPIEKVKSGKIHVEGSGSLTSLRKHLLEKASKADVSATNEIILPNMFNSASLVNQKAETDSQNIIEKESNDESDTDLEQQFTTVQNVELNTSKIPNEGKVEEREELMNTQSESKNHNTNFPSHEELVIPLNLLKIFSDNNAGKESDSKQKDVNFEEKTTTSSSIVEDETSTMKINEEQVQESGSNNSGSDIFGKETGSDKVLSLIKNGEKGIIEFTKHVDPEGENSILLPSQLLNSRKETSQTLADTADDNMVEIKEPGSKVVIIKPNSDILKAKKESDSFALNTENGNYEVEIESTTSRQSISEKNSEGVSERLGASHSNSEDLITNKPMSEDESKVTTLGQKMEKSTTESYIPFGLAKERNNAETVNEMQIESLTNNEVAHEVETSDSEPVSNDNISDKENQSASSDSPSAYSVKSDTSENLKTENFDTLVSEDKESQNYYDDEGFDYDANYPQNGQFQRKIDTDIQNKKSPQNYIYNHRIEENPLPYVLQTRKGLIEVDPVVNTPIRAGGIQNRRDDSQQTFGKDSPFFIKLPGTQDMVPVFLQYEPVKVKYVNAEKFFKKKPGNAIDKTETKEKIDKDVSSTTSKKIIKIMNKDKYSPKANVDEIPNDYLNVDFHLRPDPFYVMDPPNLSDKFDENVEEDNNEVETVSINVEGKLGFNKQQNIPDAIKEDKPVYPGEYFIKNPDNSYSSSDTSSLTNPVFSLGSKVTLPPRESVNLQYTPFPLTTNPPKKQTPEDAENEIEGVSISPLPLYSPTTKKSTVIITSDPNPNSTENTPSIEYSPVPFIDYPDSYGPFEFPDIPFVDNNEDLLFDDSPESLSEAYPEKAAFITGIKNEKLIDEPLKKNNDFDIVALANFLHQNQKVWSNPKATPNPEANSWRSPSWDDVIHSAEQPEEPPSDSDKNLGPWVERKSGMGEERYYSAFHSPEEVPGLDPAFFSYRKMPSDVKEIEPLKEDSNLSVEKRSSSDVDGIMRYIENLPLIMQKAVMSPKSSLFGHKVKRSAAPASAGEHVYCEWNVKTEPGLYLLVTFHNLSAPYTVDCYGAYIEVERENNGYDARWCGNRATVPGARPHVIFAKSEVRITLYDNGDAAKTYPTGFEAEIEVIDLFDTEEYKHFIEKKATPKIRRLMEG